MQKEYFDDYAIGERFITFGRTVTEADIVLFAALSDDWHPLNTDKEDAEKAVLGERIAHWFVRLGT